MNREFLELYDRELKILYERSKEFAEEFPGVAERLGGLVKDRMDPGIAGLLEGSAFMAARVQLKLKSEFAEFTTAMLDQLIPGFLAPTPSATIVQATPPYDDPDLANGLFYKRGAYIDAVFVEQERRISCRYRLRSDLQMWPLHIEQAQYFSAATPIQALGVECAPGVMGGLKLSFRRLTDHPEAVQNAGTGAEDKPLPVKSVMADRLTVHLAGMENDTIALYELLFANCRKITFRWQDEQGDPVFATASPDMLEQIGFSEEESLFELDDRQFSGLEILRDFFTFPSKFLGFRLNGLRKFLSRIDAPAFDIIFEFDSSVSRLASIVRADMFRLYCAPASNLFEMQCSRVPVRRNEHEHHVVPDISRTLDFEAHTVLDVYAHYQGRKEKERVYPLYSLPEGNIPARDALYYTYRRLPRRYTSQERRNGPRSSYTGTDLFLSLREPASIDDTDRVRELSVRVLASNRHLTDQLPTGEAGADFILVDNTSIPLVCVAGPTRPRESVVNIERKNRDLAPSGLTLWKLVNLLSFNHLGLSDRNPQDGAGALRELLALFADLNDMVAERKLRGIESVETRPIVRRVRQATGFNAARGMEVTIHFDEKAFEGTGIFLIGAVLDRFMAEYTAINSFTETVISSKQRGVVKRWPPRSGLGRTL
ncbi:MAG: type VI secretion system baseplate subunit TssF [Rhizobiaceae bacterium]|nr:type VI secretion system baseplate subunit TssF [Rhizobiaceae bacterium]MCV0408188.1 type VI secretion system baseplate subunit TssF [Rhizobiaceae bacterium]